MTDTTEALEPVRVHIVADATKGPAAPERSIRTEFVTETVDDTNTVRPILPQSDARVMAHVQVTGGDVVLCDSESRAQQAAGSTTPAAGAVLPSANTGPWPLRGHNAVWAAQVTAGKTCVISVAAEYRV